MKGKLLLAGETLHEFLARMRIAAVREVLAEEKGVRANMARRLGITREGLWKILDAAGVAPATPGRRRGPRPQQLTLMDQPTTNARGDNV